MEPTVTKRLHISGLTPSITQQDLSQRLSAFGNVRSLDGLGALDTTGRPKKFAYATLEATPAKLSRCLNTLSGSTWKGAKLRIGEAKPDFRERILAENAKYAAEAEQPRKKARWKYAPYTATHAQDMSPITLESAKLKESWVVTPLGRAHRPLKMRPLRPLPPLASSSVTQASAKRDLKGKGKEVKGKGLLKERKRIREPDSRARRRKIDMTKYGSVYLKGRFLEADVPLEIGGTFLGKGIPGVPAEESSDDEGDEEMTERMQNKSRDESDEDEEQEVDEESEDEDEDEDEEPPVPFPTSNTPLPPQPPPGSDFQLPTTSPTSPSGINFDQEKKQSLNLLASLFGNPNGVDEDDEDDWIGREAPDSDIDDADLARARVQSRTSQNENVDFEIVPRGNGREKPQSQKEEQVMVEEVDVEMEDVAEEHDEEPLMKEPVPAPQAPTQASTAPVKLKDLFAPAEAEGGFSLLDHLNLDDDLELDEDVPFPTTAEANDITTGIQVAEHEAITVPTTITSAAKSVSRRQVSQITLDPSQPLFFPLALLATHPAASDAPFLNNPDVKNQPKDMYDTLKAKGWDWRSSGFYRTQTDDEIRQRWEEQKGELTQGWKKRWREAGRLGRRRGKVRGEEG